MKMKIKYTIPQKAMGYLMRRGRFVRMLTPGEYIYPSALGYSVKTVIAEGAVDVPAEIPVQTLLQDEVFAANTVCQDIPAGGFGFVIANGRPVTCVTEPRVLWWSRFEQVEVKVYVPETPDMPEDFPREMLKAMSLTQRRSVLVPATSVGILYFDNRFERLLEPGFYHFWNNGVQVSAQTVTTARQLLDLPCQELLTADRITVRVTMAAEYAITDARTFAEGVTNGEQQLGMAARLALRDYVGSMKLEELLERKSEFSGFLLERLGASDCAEWCTVFSAGIKDIIIPGDIREIMNTVLVAEKQAQASVIARREEVASTRSLLNTARMMDENPTLMRLKELEYLERICERVDSISVSGGADLLGQLSALCGKKE